MTQALWQLSAVELAEGYRTGAWSPVDALDSVLARMQAVNPLINAVIALDKAARQAAQASAQRYAAGEPLGGLDGVPVSIKDNLLMAGLPASWGCRSLAAFRPEQDELPVAALRAQGAVLFGKTNVPEFTLEGYTSNGVYGTTGNPWNPALTPGGSSGGAVAALAAGIGPLALGTDGGGSIRRPSGHAGVVGLKPSIGAIARAGGFPSLLLDFEVVGPIGRSVADVALMFNAIAGPRGQDRHSRMLPAVSGKPQRMLFVPSLPGSPVDPAIRACLDDVAQAFSQLGLHVQTGDLPLDLSGLNNTWAEIGQIGLSHLFAAQPAWREHASEKYLALAQAGDSLPARSLWAALERIAGLRSKIDGVLSEWDVILMPAAAAQPWPAAEAYPPVIDGVGVGPRGHAVFTGWVNACGNPAISVPAAQSPDGMPIGLQLVGAMGADRMLLDLAARYEAARPWGDRFEALWRRLG